MNNFWTNLLLTVIAVLLFVSCFNIYQVENKLGELNSKLASTGVSSELASKDAK